MQNFKMEATEKMATGATFDAQTRKNNLEKSFAIDTNPANMPKVEPYSMVLNSGTKIAGQKTDKSTYNSRR